MPFAAQDIRNARLHLRKSDPVLNHIIKQVGPFRCKVNRNRFQSLAHSIISQQISGAAAKTIRSRLDQTAGPGNLTPVFILELGIDELRQLGISRQKATYLIDLAEKVESKQVDLDRLTKKDDSSVIAELVQVKGIGIWTAQMFLMFSLARLDVFPVDDLGIQNAIAQWYPADTERSRQDLLDLSQSWRPFSTVASWYLWRSLELPE